MYMHQKAYFNYSAFQTLKAVDVFIKKSITVDYERGGHDFV